MIPPDSMERWAIASFVYVDPRMENATEDDPTVWEGQRELMLFSGTGAADICEKAILYSRETEATLVAYSSEALVAEVRGDIGPYLPTRFLGFEEIAFTEEPPADGAVISLGKFDTQADEINAEGGAPREWRSPSWALVEASLAPGNCWLLLVHANSRREAVAKAERVLQSGEVRSVTHITEENLFSGCDLLCFPTAHPAAVWRRLVKPHANLAIAAGLDPATLDPSPAEVTRNRQEQFGPFLSAIREKWIP